MRYNYIYWNRETGSFVAIADPDITVNSDPFYPRKVFVVLEGNTIKDTLMSMNVKLTHDGINKMISRMILGKRKYKTFREYQIRNFHPEFGIEKMDELVEKNTLFEKLAYGI